MGEVVQAGLEVMVVLVSSMAAMLVGYEAATLATITESAILASVVVVSAERLVLTQRACAVPFVGG